MNPFTLPGPPFLAFYAGVIVVVVLLVRFVHARSEQGVVPKLDKFDPYEVAFLRGGVPEAIRLAIVGLIERDQLESKESGARLVASKLVEQRFRHPLEKKVVEHFARGGDTPTSVFTSKSLALACEPMQNRLDRLGVVAGPTAKANRRGITMAGVLALSGVAAIKVVHALAQGRTNLLFLLLLWIGGMAWLNHVHDLPRTATGNRLLADLQTLFQRLKARKSMVRFGSTGEAELLAAVFGLSELKSTRYAYIEKLFPKVSTSGGSCGGSCGSGGGGGGGCGGCGG